MGAWNWADPERKSEAPTYDFLDIDIKSDKVGRKEKGKNNNGKENENPEFIKLYKKWERITNLHSDLCKYRVVKSLGKEGDRCTAKFYYKDQADTGHLSLYLKDVVFSSLIDHPNILSPLDYFSKPIRIHIYDNIEGGTLAEMMLKTLQPNTVDPKLPPEPIQYNHVCTIMYQLLETVAKMHKRKIIHRDINPHNIVFLRENDLWSLRLMNFESAIYVGEPDDIEIHCNSMLKDLMLGEFLKMRNILMNNLKKHENPKIDK